MAINGISELFLLDLAAGETLSWNLSSHAVAIALSPDGCQLAVAMEPAPGRSVVELRDIAAGTVARSRELGSSRGARTFLELAP